MVRNGFPPWGGWGGGRGDKVTVTLTFAALPPEVLHIDMLYIEEVVGCVLLSGALSTKSFSLLWKNC
jgi:hypothetical protein